MIPFLGGLLATRTPLADPEPIAEHHPEPNILHGNPPVACLCIHPDDWGPIVRRCRRMRGHNGTHSSTTGIGADLGDRWANEDQPTEGDAA